MWYEPPLGIHRVARNASRTDPATIVVFFILEKGQPLLLPTKESA
jgi:hypothetical protein